MERTIAADGAGHAHIARLRRAGIRVDRQSKRAAGVDRAGERDVAPRRQSVRIDRDRRVEDRGPGDRHVIARGIRSRHVAAQPHLIGSDDHGVDAVGGRRTELPDRHAIRGAAGRTERHILAACPVDAGQDADRAAAGIHRQIAAVGKLQGSGDIADRVIGRQEAGRGPRVNIKVGTSGRGVSRRVGVVDRTVEIEFCRGVDVRVAGHARRRGRPDARHVDGRAVQIETGQRRGCSDRTVNVDRPARIDAEMSGSIHRARQAHIARRIRRGQRIDGDIGSQR